MQPPGNISDDLGYVRAVVDRAERADFPRALAYLWAAIGLAGFSLIDFAPERVMLYWTIAAPLGFLLSFLIGWRQGRSAGQESARTGRVHLLHWGALLVAIFLLYPLIATGALRDATIAQVIILMVALGYFLAGVHIVPALKWAGLAMGAGYVATLTLDRFTWTALGVLFAIGLIAAAHMGGRPRDQQAA